MEACYSSSGEVRHDEAATNGRRIIWPPAPKKDLNVGAACCLDRERCHRMQPVRRLGLHRRLIGSWLAAGKAGPGVLFWQDRECI